MLTHLLSVMTPELIIHAIKQNPKVIMDTIQKFDTFKLVGSCLTLDQQLILSNNVGLVNDFLSSSEGRAAVGLWADEFTSFVDSIKKKLDIPEPIVETQEQLEARIREEVESKIRAELSAPKTVFQDKKAA